jgi:hypothetical protein
LHAQANTHANAEENPATPLQVGDGGGVTDAHGNTGPLGLVPMGLAPMGLARLIKPAPDTAPLGNDPNARALSRPERMTF